MICRSINFILILVTSLTVSLFVGQTTSYLTHTNSDNDTFPKKCVIIETLTEFFNNQIKPIFHGRHMQMPVPDSKNTVEKTQSGEGSINIRFGRDRNKSFP